MDPILSKLTTEQLQELRQANGDLSKITTETLRALKEAQANGRWKEQPKTETTMREPEYKSWRSEAEPTGEVERKTYFALDPAFRRMGESFDWLARNVVAGGELTGLAEPGAAARLKKFQAERQMPTYEPRTPTESVLKGVSEGLGEAAGIIGPGKLAAVSKVPYLAGVGRFLSTDPGLQALLSSIGGVGTELTGDPTAGAMIGATAGLGTVGIQGAKKLLFSPPLTLTEAEKALRGEILRGLEKSGRSIESVRRNLESITDPNVPLAAADPVLRQVFMDALNQPGFKKEVQDLATRQRGYPGPATTLGNAPPPVPGRPSATELGEEYLRIAEQKILPQWGRKIEKDISALNNEFRDKVYGRTVDDTKIERLNEILKNPGARKTYDELMDTLRRFPDYAPSLPDDPRLARAALGLYDRKIAELGPKAADAWFSQAYPGKTLNELRSEALGTKGLTENLLDRFERTIAQYGYVDLNVDAARNEVTKQMLGGIESDIAQDLKKLRSPEMQAAKNQLAELYKLKEAGLADEKIMKDFIGNLKSRLGKIEPMRGVEGDIEKAGKLGVALHQATRGWVGPIERAFTKFVGRYPGVDPLSSPEVREQAARVLLQRGPKARDEFLMSLKARQGDIEAQAGPLARFSKDILGPAVRETGAGAYGGYQPIRSIPFGSMDIPAGSLAEPPQEPTPKP